MLLTCMEKQFVFALNRTQVSLPQRGSALAGSAWTPGRVLLALAASCCKPGNSNQSDARMVMHQDGYLLTGKNILGRKKL